MHIDGTSEPLTIPAGLLIYAGLSPEFIAKFSLFVAILLIWVIACGKILKHFFHLPTIAGRIIGGILLGPSLINIAQVPFFSEPFTMIEYTTGQVYSLVSSDLMIFFILLLSSSLTVSYLMWIAGHETDLADILSVGLTAVCAGVFGALLPIIMVAGVLYYGVSAQWSLLQSISMGLIFSATSVSIPVAMLFEYNKMHLKSSKAALGAAVIDDIVAVIIVSFFFLSLQSGMFGIVKGLVIHDHGATFGMAIFSMVSVFVSMIGIGYFIIPPFIRLLKVRRLSHLIAPIANGIMLLYFAFAELIGGLAGITGAYFAGLFHRMGDRRHTAAKVISPFVNAILLPLFLGSIGLYVDMRVLTLFDWGVVVLILFFAIISKLVSCWMATALSNIARRKGAHRWSKTETFLFGSSMVARGEVGLVIATILYGSRLILTQQYVTAVVVVVLTTVAAPIMLAFGFARLRMRPIAEKQMFALNIGLFPVVGTTQMFHIIVGQVMASGLYRTSVRMSEGRRVVNVEGQNVKIILCPEEGILFKGDRENIDEMLSLVKQLVIQDVDRLSLS